MDPIVSIVIPCFNNGNLLKEMIDCIVRQTINNWELIIVDDQSTDNTFEEIKEYTNQDGRIHIIRRNREPKNGNTCRNIGIKSAKGKYLVIFDADDLIPEYCLEARVNFMENNPDIDFASFPAKSFKEADKLPTIETPGKIWGRKRESYTDADDLSLIFMADYPYAVWCNIYRMDKIKDMLWDENIYVYQDFDFMVQTIFKGLRHEYADADKISYYYRTTPNPNAVTSNFVNSKKCKSTIYLFNKTLKQIKQTKNTEIYKSHLLGIIILHYKRMIYGASKKDLKDFESSILSQYINLESLKMINFFVNMIPLSRFRDKTRNKLINMFAS